MRSQKIQEIKDRLAELEKIKAKDKIIIQNFKDIIQKFDNKGIN